MFSTKLKRPLLALAVTVGLLAVAGPASAAVVTTNNDPEQVNSPKPFSIDVGGSEAFNGRSTGLKSDSNEVAVEGISLANSGPKATSGVMLDYDGSPIKNAAGSAGAIVYNGHAGLGANWAATELDANANAFLPDVNDDVLAWIVYSHPEVA